MIVNWDGAAVDGGLCCVGIEDGVSDGMADGMAVGPAPDDIDGCGVVGIWGEGVSSSGVGWVRLHGLA